MQGENTEKRKKFSDRLRGLRLRSGKSQSDLAKELGESAGSVGNWESGRHFPQPATIWKLAEYFKVSTEFLLGEDKPHSSEPMMLREAPPVMPAVRGNESDQAPVVSWASAGPGGVYNDLAEYLDETVHTDCRDENKYALIVEGESMSPEFRPGDRIVLAPNQMASNGDVVVARLRESGEVFFKLYHEVGGKIRLTSLHPSYPPMEFEKTDFRFIHPVYQMTRKTKGRRH